MFVSGQNKQEIISENKTTKVFQLIHIATYWVQIDLHFFYGARCFSFPSLMIIVIIVDLFCG